MLATLLVLTQCEAVQNRWRLGELALLSKVPVHENDPLLSVITMRATALDASRKPRVGWARQTISRSQELVLPMALAMKSCVLAPGLISRCDNCGMLRLKFSGYWPAGSAISISRSSPSTTGDQPMASPAVTKSAPERSKTCPSLPAKRNTTREGVPGVAPAPRNINAARSEAAFAELSFKAATRVPLPASCQSSAAMFTRGRGTAREKPICKGCPCLSCAMRRSRSRFNCFSVGGSQVCHLGGHQATTHICRLQARSAQLCRLRCRAHRRCIHLSGWHGERREGNGRKQGQTEGVVAIHGRSFWFRSGRWLHEHAVSSGPNENGESSPLGRCEQAHGQLACLCRSDVAATPFLRCAVDDCAARWVPPDI